MKKGFTLIELLAVIVILAIIAVIAVPIVITIINDSTSSTTVRSGEFYLDAVENAIAKKNMDAGGNFNPDTCTINKEGNISCGDETLEIEIDGERPTGGFLKYKEGRLIDAEIEFIDDSIVMNKDGKLVSLNNDMVCVKVTEKTKTTGNIPIGEFLPGDEYICEVKEGTEYHFFVLSTEEDKVNLIMERNIAYDSVNDKGMVATETNKGLVAWYDSANNHSYGPVTAMSYLHNATKDWDNVPNMIMNYEDENIDHNTRQKGTTGCGSIKTTDNITIITSKNNEETGRMENLKARMPRYNEVTRFGECRRSDSENCPLWIFNFLSDSYGLITGEGLQIISGIEGYWTLSTWCNLTQYTYHSLFVDYDGEVDVFYVTYGRLGVRPVITLKL